MNKKTIIPTGSSTSEAAEPITWASQASPSSPSARSPVRERLRVGELARELGGGEVFLGAANK